MKLKNFSQAYKAAGLSLSLANIDMILFLCIKNIISYISKFPPNFLYPWLRAPIDPVPWVLTSHPLMSSDFGNELDLFSGGGGGGGLDGVTNVACRFLETAMSHVSVAYFPQCHMSNLRNDYVPCHYILKPHVPCHYAQCHMSNLRNDHVALSILGVKGHFR